MTSDIPAVASNHRWSFSRFVRLAMVDPDQVKEAIGAFVDSVNRRGDALPVIALNPSANRDVFINIVDFIDPRYEGAWQTQLIAAPAKMF